MRIDEGQGCCLCSQNNSSLWLCLCGCLVTMLSNPVQGALLNQNEVWPFTQTHLRRVTAPYAPSKDNITHPKPKHQMKHGSADWATYKQPAIPPRFFSHSAAPRLPRNKSCQTVTTTSNCNRSHIIDTLKIKHPAADTAAAPCCWCDCVSQTCCCCCSVLPCQPHSAPPHARPHPCC